MTDASPPEPPVAAQDNITTCPHLLHPGLKLPGNSDFAKWTPDYIASCSPELQHYIGALSGWRAAVMDVLRNLNVDPTDKSTKVSGYLETLLLLANSGDTPGKQVEATGSQGVLLRRAANFTWSTAYAGSGSVSASDVWYEVGSLLLASATWNMAKASSMCAAARGELSSTDASQAFKLLREAVGMLDDLEQRVLPLLASADSPDLSLPMVQALRQICLADAQALSLVRAIKKGHTPSVVAGLAGDCAQLYLGAFGSLYKVGNADKIRRGKGASEITAEYMLGTVAQNWAGVLPKLAAYCKYKYCLSHTVAHTASGLDWMQKDKAGAAVRLTAEAEDWMHAVAKHSKEFDKCAPATNAADHAPLDKLVDEYVKKSAAKVKKDNDTVYLQGVPSQMPALSPPTRLVEPIPFPTLAAVVNPLSPPVAAELAAFVGRGGKAPPPLVVPPPGHGGPVGAATHTLPAVSAAPHDVAVTVAGAPVGHVAAGKPGHGDVESGKPAHGEEKKPEAGACGPYGKCCRCLVYCLLMPLLVIVSLVGMLVWLLLWPLTCCCPCIGCPAQAMLWLVTEIIKAPINWFLWAFG